MSLSLSLSVCLCMRVCVRACDVARPTGELKVTCAMYVCPSGYIRRNTGSTTFTQSNCCQCNDDTDCGGGEACVQGGCQLLPIEFGAWGSTTCDNGYSAITDEATCKSTAQANGLTCVKKFHRHCKGMLPCVACWCGWTWLPGAKPLHLYALTPCALACVNTC